MDTKFARISGGFLLVLALMFLVLPLKWLLAASAAAIFHEMCHYLAIRVCSGKTTKITLCVSGARMTLPQIGPGKEMICALAGPAGGLLLLLFAKWIPKIAVCAAFQSLFNLLPIYPLDGGRAMQGLLRMLCKPPVCRFLYGCIAAICRVSICILAIYATFWLHLGIFPILLAGLLLMRAK